MSDARKHRVPGVLGPGAAAIVAVGHRLNAVGFVRQHVAGGRVKSHDHWLGTGLQPGRVPPIDDGRAGENGPILVRGQRRRQFRPVDQVFTDRVAPVDVAIIEAGAGGIMLGEEVVFPVVEEEAVDVAHPPLLVGEVELWAIGLVVELARASRGFCGRRLRRSLALRAVPRVVRHSVGLVSWFRCTGRHQVGGGLRSGLVDYDFIREQPHLGSGGGMARRDRADALGLHRR